MWGFLASECLFFGALISSYLLYRSRAPEGVTSPHDVYDIPYTSVSSFVLLMSSLTMVLALAAIQRGDHRRLRIWLLATAFLGTVFIGGQVYEFTVFTHEGLNLSTQRGGQQLLRAHRLPRGARHRRDPVAAVAGGHVAAGPATGREAPRRSRSPASTGTSSTSCGSSSSPSSTWSPTRTRSSWHGRGATRRSGNRRGARRRRPNWKPPPSIRGRCCTTAPSTATRARPSTSAIAILLAVITALEVGALLHRTCRNGCWWRFLMVLAVIKFAMVAAFFMHLKFDSPMLRRLFVTGIILAVRRLHRRPVHPGRPGLTRLDLPYAWHAHPDVWLLIAVLLGGYFWALRRLGPAPHRRRASRWPTRLQKVVLGLGRADRCGWAPTGPSTTCRRDTSTAST